MRLFSDPGGFENIHGTTEYRRLVEKALRSLTVVNLEVKPDEVSWIDDVTILDMGTWSEEFAIIGQVENVKMNGAYMGVWKKQLDGVWRIHRLVRNRHDFLNPTFEQALD